MGRRGPGHTIGEGKQRAVTRDRKGSDPGQVKEEERVNHDRKAGTRDRREEMERSDPEREKEVGSSDPRQEQ
jgi:hypothetical protein